MKKMFSDKQENFLRKRLKRINLLYGSVRSGKTWISLLKWALWLRLQPKEHEYLMVGKTLTSLKRNCLVPLEKLIGTKNISYSISQKKATISGRTVWLEGANDDRAEGKIRGLTLMGIYIDELSLIPKDFYLMALSRLSLDGAILLATTNPDNPNHYTNKDIILNDEIDKQVIKFLIDDNIALSDTYKNNLKKEYTGVFYQRFILGNYVAAEGLIYSQFTLENNVVKTKPRQYTEYHISVDYGTYNPCSMGLWGLCEGAWYRIKEYYHNGREKSDMKTDEEYYSELLKLAGNVSIRSVIVDPSAASFIATIQKKKKFKVQKANNKVVEGIQNTAVALANQKLLFNDCCVDIISEFGSYLWDSKASEDKPIKTDDHAMDDMRYFVMNVLRLEKAPKEAQAPSPLDTFFTDKPKPNALGKGDKIHVI